MPSILWTAEDQPTFYAKNEVELFYRIKNKNDMFSLSSG